MTNIPPGLVLRRAGLFWMWLHVPVMVAIYAPAILTALRSVPEPYRPWLAAGYFVQAAFLMTLLYLVTWPLSLSGRVYRVALPLVTGLATVVQFVDSPLYQAVGFHMNGLFLRVLRQPEALREVGIPAMEVLGFGLVAVAWTVIVTQFVFRDVQDQLETHLTGDGEARDADMLARARRFVDGGGEQPQFLFLFFIGTHFRYSYPDRSARFSPVYQGAQGKHDWRNLARQDFRHEALAAEIDSAADATPRWMVRLT